MNHVSIANKAGVTLGDLNYLLDGHASANLAKRFGVTMADIDAFIRGQASQGITEALGLETMSAAMELGTIRGQELAMGIIIGYLLRSGPSGSARAQ